VLAIGQLTHHLIGHLSWRGSAETLVMPVAVCGVWAFTSFEVTLLDIERRGAKAGIALAFDDSPWLFVIPMLLALTGPGGYAAATAPTPLLRQHFLRVLIWVAVAAPFRIAGAVLGPERRIWSWAAAAFIDLLGTWTAYPDRAA
jgi:low temperature requirement protein LtrA